MARKFILQNLIKLAQNIGANPSKLAGTRTNITFLGTGPTKNPMFQGPVLGIEAEIASGKPSKRVISAIEDALGYAQDNKLNPIQLEALTLNMEKLNRALNPPVLPLASVTPIKEGIKSINLGNILNQNPEYKALLQHKLKNPRMYPTRKQSLEMTREEALKMFPPSRLPEPGSAGVTAMLDQKTGMSRAIARQILQQDTRLNLRPEELYSLRTGAKGEDPIDLMVKYYGRSMENFDDFLNNANLEAATPAEFAEKVLKHIKLVPQFAHGGLARILEV